MPLFDVYTSLGGWLAKRIHGPMPDASHLSQQQQMQFENALFDRTPPWFWATLGISGAVVAPLVFLLVFHFRIVLVLPLLILAVLMATPILQIVMYGRERKARIEELRRLGPLPICPECGYDLRASPERCPECGTGGTETDTE